VAFLELNGIGSRILPAWARRGADNQGDGGGLGLDHPPGAIPIVSRVGGLADSAPLQPSHKSI
jgi:hypothetical protein